jgi:hypothetical protein
MVDVTGIEPVTPCLQSRRGKTLNALSGVAYTENQQNFRSLKCTEVVPSCSVQAPTHAAIIDDSCISAGQRTRK